MSTLNSPSPSFLRYDAHDSTSPEACQVPWPPSGGLTRNEVRAWLIDGHSPSGCDATGTPIWIRTLENRAFEALDELVHAGADLNLRDAAHQGWLHHAAAQRLDSWLTLVGLNRLNHTWWWPNQAGTTPFQELHWSVRVAQAMGLRWWSESRPWSQIEPTPGDLERRAKEVGRDDLSRVWNRWRLECERRQGKKSRAT